MCRRALVPAVSERPATDAVRRALRHRKRNLLAVAVVVGAFAIAAVIGSPTVYFTASLVAFCAWMAWFVHAVIAWIRLADF
jgi:hypothetical protein